MYPLSRDISVLSVEPYGMKHPHAASLQPGRPDFSALGRAVWDETISLRSASSDAASDFSALGRAVWDETCAGVHRGDRGVEFQCSRSSRMG